EEVKKEKKEERPVIEHIDTKVEKLAGPKTLGTIDLSQFAKKPSQKNKGKRERIHKGQKEKVDINSKDFKKNSANKSGANKNSGGRPNNGHNGQNNNNNSSRRPNNNNNTNNRHQNSRHKGKFTKQPFKAVIDEDQIQKQIKETYARMTEGKGKTKGSKHRREKRDQYTQKINKEHEIEQQTSNVLKVTEFVTVNELAILMDNTPVTKVIEACMNLGLMVSINQRLDAEALVIVAEEFGYKVEFVGVEEEEIIDDEKDDSKDLISRPPIVTVMGHVDHGKTSLLDHIRKTNVIAGEAGGITQHIGAYNVKLASGQKITFLDTPGHEAFTAMRARGAKITDLAIIIIAADDTAKLMPQTVEAINHARAAGVPMVFAINKIDKPGANPEIIKEFLSKMDILVEEWGGKYQCQEISAKKGINISELLDKVLLEAEFLDLKANPKRLAKGSVIESALDKGRGYTATILVQNGTLRVGDMLLSGSNYGRVKAMFNERGQKVKEAGPSTPVTVLGLNGAPTAGETFNVLNDEKEVKDIAAKREQLLRIQGLRTQKHITLEEIGRRIAIGNFQELNIIVKGDVDGSIEALSDSLIKLSNEEIHVNVIHKAVGAISESDVLLATASNAIIIGFQVRPDQNARRMAEKEEIDIRLYSVIYDAINEVKSGIEGMLAPEEKEEVTANAEVKEIFKITKVGTIAGCIVTSGKLTRTSKVRVIRDGIVVYTGELGSLKRFKDDVKEVITGQDCGLNIANFNDIKVNDIVEAYNIVKIKRTL
ncbi:MAG: translation initiation factor IF-2, partial [Bacteroidales bacterium]